MRPPENCTARYGANGAKWFDYDRIIVEDGGRGNARTPFTPAVGQYDYPAASDGLGMTRRTTEH
jgi:hypothetical protein